MKTSLNQRITRLGWVFTALFLVLILNLTYLQSISSSRLSAKPENIRPLLDMQKIKRGDIISADGKILAQSLKEGDTYKRRYPHGKLTAPVTGFYSTKYGRSGLELTFDEYLAGQTRLASVDDYLMRLLGKDAPGNDLVLTLDMDIQRQAQRALGARKGAAVALDPKTGAVLALVSNPGFDPNSIDSSWAALSKNTEGALVNRSLKGKLTPGSTFKIITAAAALESGKVTPETQVTAPATVKIYGGHVTNFEESDLGTVSFAEAFAKSANTAFAGVAKDLGGRALVAMAKNFGFTSEIPFDLSVSPSYIPGASEQDELEVAWTGTGQGRLSATPLQMALVASAVANGGEIMQPYLVEKIVERDGLAAFEQRPRVWRKAIKPETARALNELMQKAVAEGTGKGAKISGIQVAGKTGTAEVGSKRPHAWFVGFAPADDPQVAVAVVVENGGTGGRIAAPIAREIMATALGK